MTWDEISRVLATGASAWDANFTREGELLASVRISAMRRDGHHFGRGEAVALRRRTVDAHVADNVVDGLDIREVLQHLK